MMTCPECSADLKPQTLSCSRCEWQAERTDSSVPVLLSRADLADPLFRRYSDNYDAIAHDDISSSIMDPEYVRGMADALLNRIGAVDHLSVCDVGAGKGFLARKLRDRGASVTAVDIALPYLRLLKDEPGMRCIVANAENLPFREEFDIVVSTDVMEHVLNVGSFLFTVNRSLRANGLLYVRVPFNEDLLSYSPKVGCKYNFVHLRSFDHKLLRTYLHGAGFRNLRFSYCGYWVDQPRSVWLKAKWLKQLHDVFLRWIRTDRSYIVEADGIRNLVAFALLRPLEITVRAEKRYDLVFTPGVGLSYRRLSR